MLRRVRASLVLVALLLGCGGAGSFEGEAAADARRSNQNAPPPGPGRLSPAEQAAQLIRRVVEGNAHPSRRRRLEDELAALPLDVPEVVQGRTACLAAWRADAGARDDPSMAHGACRAVLVVLAGRYGLRHELPMGPQPRPAPSVAPAEAAVRVDPLPDGTTDAHLTGALTDDDPRVEQDDSPYDEYLIEVRRGWTIEVDMRSSELDTYLWLIAPDGSSVVQDDDGGEGTDSRYVHVARMPGTYTVRANSYDGRGRYTLHVRAHP